MKTVPNNGRANRSKTWIRLCPRVAMITCTTTMTRKASQKGTLVDGNRACRANAPLTLLTMNQPKEAVTPFRAAGRMLPRKPNAPRLVTIIGTPNFGPQEDRTPCDRAPRAVPMMMAVAACHRFRPRKATAMTPMKTVANSRLGESHVQNIWIGLPWRSFSAMYSTPPGSTVATLSPYSPSRTGTCFSTSSSVCTGHPPLENPTAYVPKVKALLASCRCSICS